MVPPLMEETMGWMEKPLAAQDALLDWLMGIGVGRAVAFIALFSITASILLTATSMAIFMPGIPLEDWLYITIAVPGIISPLVGFVIMSLAYQLAAAKATLTEMAETDPLTGIGNRRRFFQIAVREIERSRRDGSALALLMVDIDHFKALNDRYGHAAGDIALRQLAQCCTNRLRATDLFCRWGGEEFIVLLPQTTLPAACHVADELRRTVADMVVPGLSEPISVSIGVAEFAKDLSALDEAIAVADQQLYLAKAEGRNCVRPLLSQVSAAA